MWDTRSHLTSQNTLKQKEERSIKEIQRMKGPNQNKTMECKAMSTGVSVISIEA